MKYAYEDLSPEQFETLILLLGQKLFGIAMQGFATGPDGGRDARFSGTAELYPSKSAPWIGTTIFQAKHTNGYNRSFAESDFFSTTSVNTVIGKEVPRIKRLRDSGELDHYILFANRSLPAGTDRAIRVHISTNCNVPLTSLYLCDIEQLELWLKTFPQIAVLANIDPIDAPLIVSSADLADIIDAFARHRTEVNAVLDHPPTARTSYEQKNGLNNMTPAYAVHQRKLYLKDTSQIQTFFAAPENRESQRLYESVVDEFQLKIIASRKDYQTFDKVMEYIAQLLFDRDAVLRKKQNKRLTRAMLFFMYWNCDIGAVDDHDVATE